MAFEKIHQRTAAWDNVHANDPDESSPNSADESPSIVNLPFAVTQKAEIHRVTKRIPILESAKDWDGAKARLEARSIPIPECGCQIWLGAYDSSGCGAITVLGWTGSTHKFSYTVYKGPVPESALILRCCDVNDPSPRDGISSAQVNA